MPDAHSARRAHVYTPGSPTLRSRHHREDVQLTEHHTSSPYRNALHPASVLGAACSHRMGFHTSETRTWGLSRTAFNMITLFAAYRCYDTLYLISV